jgi:hypothetical protein
MKGAMDQPLPELPDLSDDELKELIRELVEEEREISMQRRLLHGKIDILKSELVARLQKAVGEGESSTYQVDIDRLSEILARKAPPPAIDEA